MKTHFMVNPERMGISPVGIDLSEHVEGAVKILDVSLRAWLLATKLVTGESQDT